MLLRKMIVISKYGCYCYEKMIVRTVFGKANNIAALLRKVIAVMRYYEK